MLDFERRHRGRTYFWRSLLFFDAWFWWYLSWPEVLLKVIARLRCLILSLYAVFQSTWLFYCLSSKLDFAAICRGRKYFWKSLLFFDAWSWRYLSWPDISWRSLLALRHRLWTLFVVAWGTFASHCFVQKSTLNAICGVPEHLVILLFAFDAWSWRMFVESWGR